MEWYYVEEGQRLGPHNEAAFAALVASGHVKEDTLVWKTGMPDWQPYSVVRSGKPPVVAVAPPPTGPWRSGKLLVMLPGTRLPDRCVKCNAPTARRLKRSLSWHSPLLYLLICAGLLVYVIVALILRKTAHIEIGLCDSHHQKRWIAIISCWVVFIAGLVALGRAAAVESGSLALVGLFAVLASAVYSALAVSPVSTKKIDDRIWLNGCSREYLADLPEWPGQL